MCSVKPLVAEADTFSTNGLEHGNQMQCIEHARQEMMHRLFGTRKPRPLRVGTNQEGAPALEPALFAMGDSLCQLSRLATCALSLRTLVLLMHRDGGARA